MNKATEAQIFITHQCQLRCNYCYENFEDAKTIDLNLFDHIVDVIMQNAAEANCNGKISIFGGEPLLHFEDVMKPCIDRIWSMYSNRCQVTFTTNGILLDEDKIKYFKDHNVYFMISCDGTRESQLTERKSKNGEDYFDILDNNIDIALKYRPEQEIRITSTPDNVKYLYDSLMWLQDKGVEYTSVVPNIFVDWDDQSLNEFSHQLQLLNDKYIEMFESFEIPSLPLEWKHMFYKRILNEYCEMHNESRTLSICKAESRCGLGINKLCIDLDGSVYSCTHAPLIPKEDNIFYLGTIDCINYDKIEQLVQLNREQLYSNHNCETCALNKICIGGCVPNNYLINNSFTNVGESYCKWNELLYIKVNELIDYFDSRQDNPLFKDYFYGVVMGRGKECNDCAF